MKVIVTGSRDLADDGAVERVLDELLVVDGWLVVSFGDCRTGGDRYAKRWCQRRQAEGARVRWQEFRAYWKAFGGRAGPLRNARMVDAGADLCVAFYQPGAENKGTGGCAKLAVRAGIEVRHHGAQTTVTGEAEQETLPL